MNPKKLTIFLLLALCLISVSDADINSKDKLSRRELMEAMFDKIMDNQEEQNLEQEQQKNVKNIELDSSLQEDDQLRVQYDYSHQIMYTAAPLPCRENHSTVIQSFPEKCMQFVCSHGIVVPVYFFEKDMCNCCEYNGRLFKEGDELPGVCVKMFCCDGEWVPTGHIDDCCSYCDVFGDPHVKPFDARPVEEGVNWYSIYSTCNHTIVQQLDSDNIGSYSPEFAVYAKFKHCWDTKYSSCLESITIQDNYMTVIEVDMFNLQYVWVNGHSNQVPYTPSFLVDMYGNKHPVLVWNDIYGCIKILGSQGLMIYVCPNRVRIYAHASLYGDIGGLCGHYNDYEQDDHMDRYTSVTAPAYHPELPASSFVNSWLTDSNNKICWGVEPVIGAPYTSNYVGVGNDEVFTEKSMIPDPCQDYNVFMTFNDTCMEILLSIDAGAPMDVLLNLHAACLYDACLTGKDYLIRTAKSYLQMLLHHQHMADRIVGPHDVITPPCDPVSETSTVTIHHTATKTVTVTVDPTITSINYTTRSWWNWDDDKE